MANHRFHPTRNQPHDVSWIRRRPARPSGYPVARRFRSWGIATAFVGLLALGAPSFVSTATALGFEGDDLVYQETFLGELFFPLTPLIDSIGGGGIVAAGSQGAGGPTGDVILTGIEARAQIDAEGESYAEVSMNVANLGSQDVGLRIDFNDQALDAFGPAELRAEAELRFLDPSTVIGTDVRGVFSIEGSSGARFAIEAESDDGGIDVVDEIFLTSSEQAAIRAGDAVTLDVFVDRTNAEARASIAIDGFDLIASPPMALDLGPAIVLRAFGRGAVVPFATGDHADLDLSLFEIYQPTNAPDDPERPPQTIQFMSDGSLLVNHQPATELNGTPFTSVVAADLTEFRFAGDLTLLATDTVVSYDAIHGPTTTPIRVYAGNDLTLLDGVQVEFGADSSGRAGPGGGAAGIGYSGGNSSVPGPYGQGGEGVTNWYPDNGEGAEINFTPGGLCVITFLPTDGEDAEGGARGGDGNFGQWGQSGEAGGDGIGTVASGGSPGLRGAGGAGGVGGVPGVGGPGGEAGESGPSGANVAGGDGVSGTNGMHATSGAAGQDGASGLDGSNPGFGLVLSGGGGGGGGGQGGGGGAGGGGGGGGAGSGGGGAGAFQSSLFCAGGSDGGRGGPGGRGGVGARGAPPGSAGPGGAGGGAIEFRARGRLSVAATIDVQGASGETGTPAGLLPAVCGTGPLGFPIPCNYSGGPGRDGVSGVAAALNGGDGGSGATGGNGGDGGPRGASGAGGHGAGGTVLLYGSVVDPSEAMVLAANGGGAASGRYVVASNTDATDSGTHSGAQLESLLGVAVPNLLIDGAVSTPTLAGLAGGAEGFGLLQGVSALSAEFDAVRNAAPANAVGAVIRLGVGPLGYDEDYLGYDMVVYLSLGEMLDAPRLGFDLDGLDRGFDVPLQLGGFANDPDFGGSGTQPLSALAPYQAYATLIPEFGTPFVRARATGAAGNGLLGLGDIVYVPEATGGLRIALALCIGLVAYTRRRGAARLLHP